MDVSVEAALKQLEYNPKWMEYGWLTKEMLYEQFERYNTGTDKNTEHYRWQSFQDIVSNNKTITNDILDKYIELVIIDPDIAMAISALLHIMSYRDITDEQLGSIQKRFVSEDEYFQKYIDRIISSRHQVMDTLLASYNSFKTFTQQGDYYEALKSYVRICDQFKGSKYLRSTTLSQEINDVDLSGYPVDSIKLGLLNDINSIDLIITAEVLNNDEILLVLTKRETIKLIFEYYNNNEVYEEILPALNEVDRVFKKKVLRKLKGKLAKLYHEVYINKT